MDFLKMIPAEITYSKGYVRVELDRPRQRVRLHVGGAAGLGSTTWLTGNEAFDLGKALVDTGAQCEHVTDANSNTDTPEAGP